MNRFTSCCIALFVFLTFAPRNWGQESHQHHGEAGTDPSWNDLMRGMDTMHSKAAAIEPSGNTDLDFVRVMVVHHQAAIDMAKAELLHGKDEQVRRLAQEIITDQQSEIELMQFWLKDHEPKESDNAHSTEIRVAKGLQECERFAVQHSETQRGTVVDNNDRRHTCGD